MACTDGLLILDASVYSLKPTGNADADRERNKL